MPGYNPYNYNSYNVYNPYNPYQDLKNMRDGIDKTLQQHQQMQNQFQNQMLPQQQIPQINQNFQLAPNQNNSDLIAKIVSGIDEVKNTFVAQNGIFVNKEMDTLWFKNISGDIKTYSLNEIIEIDPKEQEISDLKKEIESMRNILNQQTSQVSKIDNESEIAPVKTEKKTK